MTKALIAGCGYLGLQVGRELQSAGCQITGVARSQSSLRAVSSAGFESLTCDLRDLSQVENLPHADIVIACQAPSKGEDADPAYAAGIEHLVRRYGGSKSRILMVSSTSVYGERSGAWVDEETPVSEADSGLSMTAKSLIKAERIVRSLSGSRGGVARLSGIYGPGRDALTRLAGSYPVWEGGNDWSNRVHRDDAARGLAWLAGHPSEETLWVVSDDEPAAREEYLRWMSQALDLPWEKVRFTEPRRRLRGSKRCSNRKIKAAGFVFKYPNFRMGYEPMIADFKKRNS